MDQIIKKPGTSETLDWAEALQTLGEKKLTEKVAQETLSALIKNSEELTLLTGERLREILPSDSRT